MTVVSGFVERCMRMRLTDQDRARILLRSRVKVDELCKRYPSWGSRWRRRLSRLRKLSRDGRCCAPRRPSG
jgi:hypothetical protein